MIGFLGRSNDRRLKLENRSKKIQNIPSTEADWRPDMTKDFGRSPLTWGLINPLMMAILPGFLFFLVEVLLEQIGQDISGLSILGNGKGDIPILLFIASFSSTIFEYLIWYRQNKPK